MLIDGDFCAEKSIPLKFTYVKLKKPMDLYSYTKECRYVNPCIGNSPI